MSDFLLKAGAHLELGASTPLMEAAQEGHLELLRYLISQGANVNAKTATGDTALTYACENGHSDVAELLLQANADLVSCSSHVASEQRLPCSPLEPSERLSPQRRY